MYRHALPPGFVLKKDKKKEEKDEEISLEELIENEVRLDKVTQTGGYEETFIVLPPCSSHVGCWHKGAIKNREQTTRFCWCGCRTNKHEQQCKEF